MCSDNSASIKVFAESHSSCNCRARCSAVSSTRCNSASDSAIGLSVPSIRPVVCLCNTYSASKPFILSCSSPFRRVASSSKRVAPSCSISTSAAAVSASRSRSRITSSSDSRFTNKVAAVLFALEAPPKLTISIRLMSSPATTSSVFSCFLSLVNSTPCSERCPPVPDFPIHFPILPR